MEARKMIEDLARAARAAAGTLAVTRGEQRNHALRTCAQAIRDNREMLQEENARDLARSEEFGLTDAMVKRLTLDDKRIDKMATALDEMSMQVDPVGEAISACNRPDGIRVEKRRVPIGVIGIIFESRPNVTSDAAGLCIKSGNTVILRGGKEAVHSNTAIAKVFREGIRAADLPEAAMTVIETTDRAVVGAMATAEGLIDLIIPRGGGGLIRAVTEAATIPVIKHYDGICHVYVHSEADLDMAGEIAFNAKVQYPAVCNAMETLLVDQAVAEAFLPRIAARLSEAGVELRGCERSRQIVPEMGEAAETDWVEEYLDLVLSIRVVPDAASAVEHINTYGSKHTDAIVTRSIAAAEAFVGAVDSSSVMVNASTRFSDGARYGLGAEIGISTDKLHARGPMGAADLTTYKWVVTGQGHIVE
jgi:glutamate-5-semialdehyde dehydrogenase